jgi:protein Tex
MNFETWFTTNYPNISVASANAVLRLVEDKATVPFIARYRKEQTGNLDELAIQMVIDAKERWDSILKRQTFILEEIERQGKLTPELKESITNTYNLDLLEDIYLPYKQKRKTKAVIAKEAGLEPFANWIWDIGNGIAPSTPYQTLEQFAETFINQEKGVADAAAAIQGAQDIITERISETVELRQKVRERLFESGHLRTSKTDKAKAHSKYERYFSYYEPIQSLLQPQNSHRYLAIRRGWLEEELSLSMGGIPDDNSFDELLLATFENAACKDRGSIASEILLRAARLALRVYVQPSIETEVHRTLKDIADETAIRVFAENVSKLLLAAPFGPKAVLGVDPGIRTGCKLAVVDASGKYIESSVMHLQSKGEQEEARKLLKELISRLGIQAIAVGNGTAGRETESFIREALKEFQASVPVVMVNESGASIYSASDVAREEFPNLDVTVRGAISIARRLQDPLAELVKTDPKSIGVGQYQHDVNQHALKKRLDLVVDTCVNSVGVNLNTASYHLLSHISGIGPTLAKRIVEYRNDHGLFQSRDQLFQIPRFSQKTFEQAAGFLRIPNGIYPLDNTGVHPERYPVLESFAARLNKSVAELTGKGVELIIRAEELRKELGDFTFEDIVKELSKPGRDPREEFIAVAYREDLHDLSDLKIGMVCPGIVTNVTNFGAFVDIGVHQDGLVHISELSDRFVKDPREVVSPGDRVKVRVLEVNLDKRQIALSMKSEGKRIEEKKETIGAKKRVDKDGKKPQDRAKQVSGFNNPFAKLKDWKG